MEAWAPWSAQGWPPSSKTTHLALCSLSLAAGFTDPGFWRSLGALGAQFSFIFLEPRDWGARAPSQCFMGHLRLFALCPNAPQSLHFSCGERRRSVS